MGGRLWRAAGGDTRAPFEELHPPVERSPLLPRMQCWIKKHLIRKEHNDAVRRDYSSSLPPPRLSIARDGSGGWFIRHTGVADLTYRLQGAANLTGPRHEHPAPLRLH